MALTRRHFITTSAAAAAAGAFGRFDLFAQQQAQAPITPVIKELRGGVGIWTTAPARGGTIGWLINPAGAIAVDSQFPDTAAAVPRAPAEDVRQDRDRDADQHPSSRRSHRRQRRLPPEDEADRRPRKRPDLPEGRLRRRPSRAGHSRPRTDDAGTRRTDRHRQDGHRRLVHGPRRREDLSETLRPRPHRRRHRHSLREGERRPHGRPDVQPCASGHRPGQRRIDRELDRRPREGRRANSRPTRSTSSATREPAARSPAHVPTCSITAATWRRCSNTPARR